MCLLPLILAVLLIKVVEINPKLCVLLQAIFTCIAIITMGYILYQYPSYVWETCRFGINWYMSIAFGVINLSVMLVNEHAGTNLSHVFFTPL